MTVKELVTELKGLKQDADVDVYDDHSGDRRRLAIVVDEDKDVLFCGLAGLPCWVRHCDGPAVLATEEPGS